MHAIKNIKPMPTHIVKYIKWYVPAANFLGPHISSATPMMVPIMKIPILTIFRSANRSAYTVGTGSAARLSPHISRKLESVISSWVFCSNIIGNTIITQNDMMIAIINENLDKNIPGFISNHLWHCSIFRWKSQISEGIEMLWLRYVAVELEQINWTDWNFQSIFAITAFYR